MAISATTDWSKIRYVMLYIFALFVLLASNADAEVTSNKHKRQLFREQLLPEHGGKIPDSAFWPERLRLNQLNSLGLYSVDGVHLEHRQPDRTHIPRQYEPNTLKVPSYDDGRYVAVNGRYASNSWRPSVSTTYLNHVGATAVVTNKPIILSAPPTRNNAAVYDSGAVTLPVQLPYHSLRLVNYYRQQHQQHHVQNQNQNHRRGPGGGQKHRGAQHPRHPLVFAQANGKGGHVATVHGSSCCTSTVISDEFAPYLKKLHELSD